MIKISKTKHQDKYRHYLSRYDTGGVCGPRLLMNVKCIGVFDYVCHVRFYELPWVRLHWIWIKDEKFP